VGEHSGVGIFDSISGFWGEYMDSGEEEDERGVLLYVCMNVCRVIDTPRQGTARLIYSHPTREENGASSQTCMPARGKAVRTRN
jgi:hypothetical protein